MLSNFFIYFLFIFWNVHIKNIFILRKTNFFKKKFIWGHCKMYIWIFLHNFFDGLTECKTNPMKFKNHFENFMLWVLQTNLQSFYVKKKLPSIYNLLWYRPNNKKKIEVLSEKCMWLHIYKLLNADL